ncbi:Uncharacterised protein [Serratia fonticola]|uniref:hypothetical protein n=1 Tax=Serratia fonticola TaxID=47917 RepID=UPI002179FF38|nr:hypothetical protein [Serratia fonticola]CAI1697849.1 Uncharacterised protein [Serratia fonticola]
MAKRFNTNNARPSNSMKDLSDNALAYDDFINSDADVAVDRFSKPFPTVRKQVADRIDELVGASQNAIESAEIAESAANNVLFLIHLYTSVAEAQVAITAGTIPLNAMFNVAVPAGSIPPRFADQYQNVAGVATPTGVSYPSSKALNDAIAQLNLKIRTVADPNDTKIVAGFQNAENGEVPFGITETGRVINPHIQEIEDTANAALNITIDVEDPDNTGIVAGFINPENGEVPFGVTADHRLKNRHIQEIDGRLDNLESGGMPQLSKIAIHLISIFGQSNSINSLGFSQVWRVPHPSWGIYPPEYSGEQDGSTLITALQAGNNRTFNTPTPTTLIPLANNIVFGSQAEGIGHGMLDSIVDVYPELDLVTFSHGVGGVPIQYLDKPTSAEIIAGNASGVVILQTSAEYLMLQANQDMTHILDYAFSVIASPYYKGMYVIAKTVALAALEDKRVICDMAWLQGETNYQDAGYQDLVYALYDDYSADVELLTQQPERMLMLLEQSNYSDFAEQSGKAGYEAWVASGYSAAYAPGGVSSAYTPESARVNTHFALNQRQNAIVDEALGRSPARLVYNVAPRYPYTSNIHMHPHAIRAYGEQFGKVWRKLRIENQQWQPLEPVSWWFDATSIFIQFNIPKGGLQFKWPDYSDIFDFVEKSTAPYGLEHSAGALQKAKITLSGRNVIRITPDVPPVPGQTISYLKSSRRGAICDSDNTAGIFTDRAGKINSLRNYCVPFTITL